MTNTLPTFIINLKKRTDRKRHIIREFEGRHEFFYKIIEPVVDENAAVSLWNTIRLLIQNAIINHDEMVMICEDDHQFTPHYSKKLLFKCIEEAQEQKCDILSGGPSCVKSTFRMSPDLYWMEDFTGLQFTVIFRRFFQRMIDFEFLPLDAADIAISKLADNKLFIYPYVSTQKEFGYSDVTYKNNEAGRVEALFSKSAERVEALNEVAAFYQGLKVDGFDDSDCQNIYFPTYVLHDPENAGRLGNIQAQFKNKGEFEVTVMEAPGYHTDRNVYTEKIKEVIQSAVANDDDIIIVCEDTHKFTAHYTHAFLIRNILEAHQQGAGLLLGGLTAFDSAVLLSKNRFWLSSFSGSQFIVIFKKVFDLILAEVFEEENTTDDELSAVTSHKMVLFPFISADKTPADPDIHRLNRIMQSPTDIAQKFARIQVACSRVKNHQNDLTSN